MDTLAIGMAAYGNHPIDIGLSLASVTGQLVNEGITLEKIITSTSMSTDSNRNSTVKTFLKGNAEWLYFMDTDNIIPASGIRRLMDAERTFISGIYHLKKAPWQPVAYWRQPDGRYRPISDWRKGEIIEVDMVGLGCALIHRSVFESIMRNYVPFQRILGGTIVVHREDIVETGNSFEPEKCGKVIDGVLYDALMPVPDDIPDATFPLFRSEYNRTEDVGFCEMAQRCGHSIFVDTSVESEHAMLKFVTGHDYQEALKESKIKIERTSDWVEIVQKEVLFHEGA